MLLGGNSFVDLTNDMEDIGEDSKTKESKIQHYFLQKNTKIGIQTLTNTKVI